MDSAQKQKAAAARREYQRQWRAKNKDKVARYNQEYWMRKAEEIDRGEEKRDGKGNDDK